MPEGGIKRFQTELAKHDIFLNQILSFIGMSARLFTASEKGKNLEILMIWEFPIPTPYIPAHSAIGGQQLRQFDDGK